jgi:hypothetical protein
MSTRIYNAYLYYSTLLNLQKLLMRIRAERMEYWLGKISESEFREYSNRHVDPVLSLSTREIIVDVDREAAVIYPFPEFGKNKFLVQFFGERPLLDRARRTRSLSDFHYQNQSDPPKNVDSKEWEQREKIWNRIFDRSRCLSPVQAGFTFVISSMKSVFLEHLNRRDRQRQKGVKGKESL